MAATALRNFIEFQDLSADTIASILVRAGELECLWGERRMPQALVGRAAALIVDDGGWRNTTAFDLGIQTMGGICVHVPVALGGREATADLAGYLDNWFDLIIMRTRELAALRDLAKATDAPVINARTRTNHPCETLGDLAYVTKKRGRFERLTVAGVAPDANILRSWIEASLSLPINVIQINPAAWQVKDPTLLNPRFRATQVMRALEAADVIFTDSWPGDAADEDLAPYQVSVEVLERCKPDVIFLPCPPVTRGQEVVADAMVHPACQSRQAKAFLLHAQNALMEWMVR